MVRVFFLAFAFLVVDLAAHGQTSSKEVLRLFNSSIRQTSKSSVNSPSNPWVACNQDSAFYKADTVALYNDYYDCSTCNVFVQWTFYKRNSLLLGEAQMCNEPTEGYVLKSNRWYSVRTSNVGGADYLDLEQEGRLVARFKVVSIKRILTPVNRASTTVIKLKRLDRPV
ncbi:MAG: hypothetical protein EOP04_14510 [Proteobacteria bacterium]|nr:MAG: hypothetical protein EOP04_14510 [Pseudomonadota bacterium]